MRKPLLGTVAVLSGMTGGAVVADAQSILAADAAGHTAPPVPGTITVRPNGRVRFYAYFATDRNMEGAGSTLAGSQMATCRR